MVRMLRKVVDFLFPVHFGVVGRNLRYPKWRVYGPFKGQEAASEYASQLGEDTMFDGSGWHYHVMLWKAIPVELRKDAYRGS